MIARLGLGSARDVVMIDAGLEQVYRLDEVPARRYARQADWDPHEPGGRMPFTDRHLQRRCLAMYLACSGRGAGV